MSGKGSAPRPFSVSADEYADRYDAIFGKKEMGRAQVPSRASNTRNESAILSAPAIYVDDETGASVTEDWWPGDKINQENPA